MSSQEVTFNGQVYRRYLNGKHPNYFFSANGKRRLHRDVYIKHKGPIPKGFHVHHIDFNPLNNSIDNLVALSPSDHQQLHYDAGQCGLQRLSDKQMAKVRANHGYTKKNWQKRRAKSMATATARITECVECGISITPTNVHQKFCGPVCRKRVNTRQSQKEYTCEACGAKFMGTTYYPRNSCTRACADKLCSAKRRRRSI